MLQRCVSHVWADSPSLQIFAIARGIARARWYLLWEYVLQCLAVQLPGRNNQGQDPPRRRQGRQTCTQACWLAKHVLRLLAWPPATLCTEHAPREGRLLKRDLLTFSNTLKSLFLFNCFPNLKRSFKLLAKLKNIASGGYAFRNACSSLLLCWWRSVWLHLASMLPDTCCDRSSASCLWGGHPQDPALPTASAVLTSVRRVLGPWESHGTAQGLVDIGCVTWGFFAGFPTAVQHIPHVGLSGGVPHRHEPSLHQRTLGCPRLDAVAFWFLPEPLEVLGWRAAPSGPDVTLPCGGPLLRLALRLGSHVSA